MRQHFSTTLFFYTRSLQDTMAKICRRGFLVILNATVCILFPLSQDRWTLQSAGMSELFALLISGFCQSWLFLSHWLWLAIELIGIHWLMFGLRTIVRWLNGKLTCVWLLFAQQFMCYIWKVLCHKYTSTQNFGNKMGHPGSYRLFNVGQCKQGSCRFPSSYQHVRM